VYCIKCGVKLADTEKKCPLCDTVVYHPELTQKEERPLYPDGKMPKVSMSRKALNGAVIILFLIPMILCFFADLMLDHALNWFGFVVGALITAYIALALPLWFKDPHPVIFIPCDFAAAALYLLYIDLVTGGGWFLPFALPILTVLCIITCTVVTLLTCLKRGRLYVFGGAFISLGASMLLIEHLLDVAFKVPFRGWCVYPLVVLVLLGGLLIYLAINKTAREVMQRKLFF